MDDESLFTPLAREDRLRQTLVRITQLASFGLAGIGMGALYDVAPEALQLLGLSDVSFPVSDGIRTLSSMLTIAVLYLWYRRNVELGRGD